MDTIITTITKMQLAGVITYIVTALILGIASILSAGSTRTKGAFRCLH